MKDYELTALERAVFAEMAERNPGTTPEMIYETSIHNDLRYIFHYFSTKSRPPLVDISPLVKLRGLDEVTLYQCQVRDISPLADIPTLEKITVSGGPEIMPCDLTPLKKLRFLCLRSTPCCAIPRLDGLPKLHSVLLSTIGSLEPLRGLDSLNYLTVDGNPPSDN